MKKKNNVYINIFLFFTIIIFLYFITYYYFTCFETFNSYDDSMKYSNTEKWGTKELNIKNSETSHTNNILNLIPDINFNKNSSKNTFDEVQDILNKQKIYDPDRVQQTKYELYIENVIVMFDVDDDEYYKIKTLIVQEVNPVVMKLKFKYNRVRPYILNDNIQMLVEKPNHPSYPSGHSSQAFFICYILTEKYPENKDKYYNIAYSIAENREYAGFHYKSDSRYGEIVGKTIASYFSKDKNPLL